jgi:N-methylhydantoinase A
MVESKVISRKKLGRKPIKGPIIIEEYEGTAVVPPDCTVKIDNYFNVIIEIKS